MTDDDIVLGVRATDTISGFEGIVTTISNYLTGCTSVELIHDGGHEDRPPESDFFYEAQIDVLDGGVMDDIGPQTSESEIPLGTKVRDTVTGIEGYVIMVQYELYECPRIGVQPTKNSVEKPDVHGFDEPRLEVIGDGIRDEYSEMSENAVNETGSMTADIDRRDSI